MRGFAWLSGAPPRGWGPRIDFQPWLSTNEGKIDLDFWHIGYSHISYDLPDLPVDLLDQQINLFLSGSFANPRSLSSFALRVDTKKRWWRSSTKESSKATVMSSIEPSTKTSLLS